MPALVSRVSGVLDVHPIFALHGGEAHRSGVVRTQSHVLRTFADLAAKEFGNDGPLWVLAFHSGDEDAAQSVLDVIRAVVRVERAEVIPLSPALGAYTGPGMTGFAAMPLADEDDGRA